MIREDPEHRAPNPASPRSRHTPPRRPVKRSTNSARATNSPWAWRRR